MRWNLVRGRGTTALVQLDRDEFDLRVGQAFAPRTYADLAALTADLPARPAAAQPLQPAWAREVARVRRPGAVLAVATVLNVSVWPAAAFLVPKDSEGDPLAGFGLVALATLVYLVVLATSGMNLLFSWQDNRSARRLPPEPAPGAGGQASPRPSSADPGRQLPPAGHSHQHTAEAPRSRLSRRSLPGSRSLRRWRPGDGSPQRPAITPTA